MSLWGQHIPARCHHHQTQQYRLQLGAACSGRGVGQCLHLQGASVAAVQQASVVGEEPPSEQFVGQPL